MDLWNDRWRDVCLGHTHSIKTNPSGQCFGPLRWSVIAPSAQGFLFVMAIWCWDSSSQSMGRVTANWWCVLLRWWYMWVVVGWKPKSKNDPCFWGAFRELRILQRLCSLECNNVLYFHSMCSHAVFEEPEDPSNRSFFSEIISSISDVKFSHSGRYLMTRDYLTVKVWDLNMESKPLETYQVKFSFCFPSHKVLLGISEK